MRSTDGNDVRVTDFVYLHSTDVYDLRVTDFIYLRSTDVNCLIFTDINCLPVHFTDVYFYLLRTIINYFLRIIYIHILRTFCTSHGRFEKGPCGRSLKVRRM